MKKEPRRELGRSRKVILLLTTAHKHSWPPGNTKNMHEATGCALTMTSSKDGFTSFNVTFMSVSLGMWSLKSSTELTKKGMWQDNTCRCHDGNKDSLLGGVNRRIYRNKDAFTLTISELWSICKQSSNPPLFSIHVFMRSFDSQDSSFALYHTRGFQVP